MPIISARSLRKRYGSLEAVRDVSFDIEAGACVGLLGPNGAGKTTTMRMLMGLTTLTGGALTLFGRPVDGVARERRARIGLVPQEDNLDPDLSVSQNLEIYGRYFGVPEPDLARRVPQLLAFMQLEERGDSRVMQLSGGMKRRLTIARSLIANPELIVLDEPTTGLDPQARVLIWRRLLDLKREGKTLLLTTHYMDEAQRLCDRIIIIDGGLVLAEGAPSELIGRFVKGHVFEVQKPVPGGLMDGSVEHEDIGDSVLFYTAAPSEFAGGLPADSTYVHRAANLEDVFLRLTGRSLREG